MCEKKWLSENTGVRNQYFFSANCVIQKRSIDDTVMFTMCPIWLCSSPQSHSYEFDNIHKSISSSSRQENATSSLGYGNHLRTCQRSRDGLGKSIGALFNLQKKTIHEWPGSILTPSKRLESASVFSDS